LALLTNISGDQLRRMKYAGYVARMR